MSASGSLSLIGLDPTTSPQRANGPDPDLAPRPVSLEGATIGVIGNGLNRGNDLLGAILEVIGRQFKLAGTVVIGKRGVSVPPDPPDWDRLVSTATVTITGYGGCGSCSSRSLRDALELEAAGLPAAAVIHECMIGSADAIARLSGRPDYPYAVVPIRYKSIATWTDTEIAGIAEVVAPAVIGLLTRR